ncbi:hypothetical protein I9W82_000048 [Candida metapsilosis]|uniref:Uncharacterized protein n=1 Tax=Candida metapsilosis TaxID=273372 RepID=A0A8H7ZFN0_9ASCO|nr:hypothetical protein I9W82_000048 [Candida metapsilosis]
MPKSTLITQSTSTERLLKHFGLNGVSSEFKEHIRGETYPFDTKTTIQVIINKLETKTRLAPLRSLRNIEEILSRIFGPEWIGSTKQQQSQLKLIVLKMDNLFRLNTPISNEVLLSEESGLLNVIIRWIYIQLQEQWSQSPESDIAFGRLCQNLITLLLLHRFNLRVPYGGKKNETGENDHYNVVRRSWFENQNEVVPKILEYNNIELKYLYTTKISGWFQIPRIDKEPILERHFSDSVTPCYINMVADITGHVIQTEYRIPTVNERSLLVDCGIESNGELVSFIEYKTESISPLFKKHEKFEEDTSYVLSQTLLGMAFSGVNNCFITSPDILIYVKIYTPQGMTLPVMGCQTFRFGSHGISAWAIILHKLLESSSKKLTPGEVAYLKQKLLKNNTPNN